MGKIVACDACKNEFEVSGTIMKNRLSNGILFTFLQCPHCEAAFLISATDENFRKQLARRARGMKRNKHLQYTDREEIKRLSEEQKQKYLSRFRELFPKAWCAPASDGGSNAAGREGAE